MTTTKLMFLVKPTRTERKNAKILLDPYEVKMFLKEKKVMKALFYITVLSNKTKGYATRSESHSI